MNALLPVFLSAYDPAELPGGTVDPLGFTAGYLVLADTLFPGMTAAAAQATYFPMLCAGLAIAEAEGGSPSLPAATARKRRIEVGLRFERLWALACALQPSGQASAEVAPKDDPDDEAESRKVTGLRGISYVRRETERLTQARARETGTQFSLLAQQYKYGAFGIYAGVADALRLLDKSTFATTPGFGRAIGQSFLETTSESPQRKELVRAALDGSAKIQLSTLRSWGARACTGTPLRGPARALLWEALTHDPERARMLELVASALGEGLSERSDRALLTACCAKTNAASEPTLTAALAAALAYDAFLRSVSLIFERVLWLCRSMNDAEEAAKVFADPVIVQTSETLSEKAAQLGAGAERLSALGRRDLLTRGHGILEFAQSLAIPAPATSTVRAVLRRHAKIQSGKFEQGRPKQAWLEERGSQFVLTTTRVGGRSQEPTTPDALRAPDWRFNAALSFLSVTGGGTAKETT